jgi:hypothetical protein
MTKSINLRMITTAAFVAAATFSILSFGNAAQASGNPLSCHGPSGKKVMDCCAQMLGANRTPSWKVRAERTCHASFVTTCSRNYAGVRGCFLKQTYPPVVFAKEGEGSNTVSSSANTPGRNAAGGIVK